MIDGQHDGAMHNRAEPACLIIADIAGYTGYMAGVELDHAQDILADLMDTVVGTLRPPFRLAKLEGDAAFAYVMAETVDGSALQDTVERTYFGFRRRLRDIKQASRCECNACILIPSLDLKVVVHHGLIARHRIAGWEELIGSAVILVHRLLKNQVAEAIGFKAYALYTQDCLTAAGIDPEVQGLRSHVETTDIAGDVTVWLRDLDAAWMADQTGHRLSVTDKSAYRTYVTESAAPPMLVWEYLTSPIRRPQWVPGVTAILEASPSGRRGAGTVNHCMHGKDAVLEEILDWQPGRSWTTRSTMPMPNTPSLLLTDELEALPDGGTRVTSRVGRPKPRDRAAFEGFFPMVEPLLLEAMGGISRALAEELERRAAEGEPEPALPTPNARFLTQPVTKAESAAATAAGTVDSAPPNSLSG